MKRIDESSVDIDALSDAIDAKLGYPIAGVKIGPGHDSSPPAMTLRHCDVVETKEGRALILDATAEWAIEALAAEAKGETKALATGARAAAREYDAAKDEASRDGDRDTLRAPEPVEDGRR